MLQDRTLEVFNFIAQYIHARHKSPTLGEIAAALNFNNSVQPFKHVSKLCMLNYLEKTRSTARAIRVLKYPPGATVPATGEVVPMSPSAPSKTTEDENSPVRMAYARGVAAGRRQMMDPANIEASALNQAYKRGYRDGKREQPKTIDEAFERGALYGRAELKKELTMQKRPLNLAS